MGLAFHHHCCIFIIAKGWLIGTMFFFWPILVLEVAINKFCFFPFPSAATLPLELFLHSRATNTPDGSATFTCLKMLPPEPAASGSNFKH